MKSISNKLRFLERGVHVSLAYICTTFALPLELSNIGVILLLVSWLGWFFSQSTRPKIKREHQPIIIGFLLLFLWLFFSLFYSENTAQAWKEIEFKLSFVMLPLVLLTYPIQKERWLFYAKLTIYTLAVVCVFLLLYSANNYREVGEFLTYHDFIRVLNLHAVIFSYYLYAAVLLIAYLLMNRMLPQKEKGILILSAILYLICLVISASKNVLVVTFLSAIIMMVSRAIKGKISLKVLLGLAVVLIVGVMAVSTYGPIKNRLKELVEFNGMENIDKIERGEKLELEDAVKFNGTSLRLLFWKIGYEQLIAHDRLLIGLSPADRKSILNKEFDRTGLNPHYKNYNLHNQFVQVFVELGLIGLILYLLLNVNLFRLAVRQKNTLLMTFLLAFTIFQMTESLLERNKSLVFFLFMIFFIIQLPQRSDEDRDTGN